MPFQRAIFGDLRNFFVYHGLPSSSFWSPSPCQLSVVSCTISSAKSFLSPTSSQQIRVRHFLPYNASYGAIPIVVWWLLLNSTKGRRSSQFPPNSSRQDLRRSSRVWMVLSDWPSVWGWNVVLKFNFVPIACCKLGHNLDVNLGSRSDIIETGTPWSLITSFTYNFC